MSTLKIDTKIRGTAPETLRRISQQFPQWMVTVTDRAVKYVHGQVPRYPAASRSPYPFKSRKQYWFVRLSIKEGTMQVPYRRSGMLGRSITTQVKKVGTDVVGTIGTADVKAPWVISSEAVGSRGPQSMYHQGVWFTLQQIVKDAKVGIVRIYKDGLKQLLGR